MSTIPRLLGGLLACLSVLALSACGSSLPEAKIGNLEIDRYVALGDGYAAAPFTGITENTDGCLRSSASYPALLAEAVDAKEVANAACLFAQTPAITRASTPARGDAEVPAQVSLLTPETDLVTITVGLSDREFARRLFIVCTEVCEDEDDVSIDQLINDLAQIGAALMETVETVAKRAPDARLYGIGYPQILPRSGECDGMPALEQNQVDAINGAMSQLNAHLRNAVRQHGGHFVDVAQLSREHDLCADEPWVQGDVNEPGQAPRFHPLPPLESAIAEYVAEHLKP